ncbi:MAG: tetratricopeptide repeat protein [Elusimicrobia bacterium]|nr:tetratricopeptide repeat protein [Elusimicrobiota bacterium]
MAEPRGGRTVLSGLLGRVTASNVFFLMGLQVFCLALYARTLGFPPIWDDVAEIVNRPFLQSCSNLATVLNPRYLLWVLPVANSARPAWLASVLGDTCLFGQVFAGFRLTSVLWHAVCAVLVSGLAWDLTRKRGVAIIAGFLFAAHPLHTETVNIVSFRTDLMSLAFCLTSLLLYRRSRAASRSGPFFAASIAAFALALLSKEMAVVLPALIVLSDRLCPVGRPDRRRELRVYGLFLAVLGAYLVFHVPRSGYVFGGHKDVFTQVKDSVDWPTSAVAPEFEFLLLPEGDPQDPMPWQAVYGSAKARILTMTRISGRYLLSLAWPWRPQGDYSPPVSSRWSDPAPWLAAALWLAWFWTAIRWRRREPVLTLAMLWVPCSLLPVCGVVALRNLQADRYAFFASAGACLAAAVAFDLWRRASKRGLTEWACVLLVASFAIAAFVRNGDYRDNRRFYEATLERDPNVARARINLAKVLEDARDDAGAEREYKAALALWPSLIQGRLLLARFYLDRGRAEDAAAVLEEGRAHAPEHAGLRYYLALSYWMSGRDKDAERDLRAILASRPRDWRASLSLGTVLLKQNRPAEAAVPLKLALEMSHGRSAVAAYHLALAYRMRGDMENAKAVIDRLSAANPALAEAARRGAGETLTPGRAF